MCGCESWTINKDECQRTDAFEMWCWRRLLRVSWTAKRSNQSILKEFNPEGSLEGLMLKLELQYFGHLMQVRLMKGKAFLPVGQLLSKMGLVSVSPPVVYDSAIPWTVARQAPLPMGFSRQEYWNG